VSTRRLALLGLLVVACGASEPETPARPRPKRSAPIAFSYGTPTGRVFDSAGTRGRVTAVLFVTTFDLPSQVMARRLDDVVRRHVPRVNAGAVVLEAPNAAPLVDVFKQTLNLHYDVALSATGAERDGPFGDMDRVPTLVVLDARGRETFRAAGVLDAREIDEALTSAH